MSTNTCFRRRLHFIIPAACFVFSRTRQHRLILTFFVNAIEAITSVPRICSTCDVGSRRSLATGNVSLTNLTTLSRLQSSSPSLAAVSTKISAKGFKDMSSSLGWGGNTVPRPWATVLQCPCSHLVASSKFDLISLRCLHAESARVGLKAKVDDEGLVGVCLRCTMVAVLPPSRGMQVVRGEEVIIQLFIELKAY